MKKKPLLLVAFLLVLYIGPSIFISSYGLSAIPAEQNMSKNFQVATTDWYDASWTYRKSISINGSSGADTDYPVRLTAYYSSIYELETITHWADSAHQGVTVDDTHVYTTNNTCLAKYTKAGVYVDSIDYTDDMSYVGKSGDLCYYDGSVYLAIATNDQLNCSILEYDVDLNFISEYETPEPTVADNLAHGGCAYYDGYFWTISDSQTAEADFQVTKYTTSWSYVNNWTVDSFSIAGTGWHYQGLDWKDGKIFLPVHEGSVPEKVDVYIWNGDGFSQFQRLDSLVVNDGTYDYISCQGIAMDTVDNEVVWIATRGGIENAGEVIKAELLTVSSGDNDEVFLEDHCQHDFDDIRFTDNDGTTLLDYWVEDIVGVRAYVWIEVDDSLNSDVTIYIYYGNDGASSLSDGDDVFEEFADFNEGNLGDANFTHLNAEASGTYSRSGGYSAICPNDGSAVGFSFDDGTGYPIANFSYIGWFYDYNQNESDSQFRTWDDDANNKDGAGLRYAVGWANYSYHSDGYNYVETNISRFRGWHKIEIRNEGVNLDLLIDDILVETTTKPTECQEWYGISRNHVDADNAYFDDLLIRKCIADEPQIWVFGDEESLSWQEVGDAEVQFVIPVDETGLNILLIFLGLAMVPCSILYLVKGGKNEISNDKVFFGLIAFVIGWALFLGGIM